MSKKKNPSKTSAKFRRGPVSRPGYRTIAFAAEGKSEENYLAALFRERYREVLTPVFLPTRGTSARQLVEAAENHATHAEAVWVMCDLDQNARGNAAWLTDWLARSDRNHLSCSNPCLEFWFLLHYVDTPEAHDARSAVSELKRQLRGNYTKGTVPKGLIAKTDTACRRSESRLKAATRGITPVSPWPPAKTTTAHELIRLLDELRNTSPSSVATVGDSHP